MIKYYARLISVLWLAVPIDGVCQGTVDFINIDGSVVEIYTPQNYTKDKPYPVVYFNDGQMLFGHKAITIALQETLDSLIERKIIKELIVVGIAADRLRSEKYVPYFDQKFETMADGTSYASYYANYLVNTIVPYMDKTYSTIATPEGRAIFGFSFGGLNAIWMTLNYPEVFSMAAGFSPSIWVNEFALFQEAEKYQPGQKIWYDIGTAEWNYYVPLQRLLKKQGAKINEDVFYAEVPGGLHAMYDWKQRIERPFLVFAGTKEHVASKMEVEIEIIPSQSNPGKYFTRLNPIVNCKSGLVYSLAYEASYEVINPEAGKVYEDGRFELAGDENLDVLVTYQTFEKRVKIRSKLLVSK